MGWLQSALVGLFLVAAPTRPAPVRDAVQADCADFVRIRDTVFTGRSGAWFVAAGVRASLGGAPVGPTVLAIGGVDPAVYLARHCTAAPGT